MPVGRRRRGINSIGDAANRNEARRAGIDTAFDSRPARVRVGVGQGRAESGGLARQRRSPRGRDIMAACGQLKSNSTRGQPNR